jgi:hypothetical protein
MGRSLAIVVAFAVTAPVLLLAASSGAGDRTLPMSFELRHEGPAAACADKCRVFVSARGAITAGTPRDFVNFAKGRQLAGATVVLDSEGGSVHGAIALGREIRRLGLNTTVGRMVDVAGKTNAAPRAKLVPQADCESMCAFILLAGVQRVVPPEARVMVHQIWLGDRRDDPTAADYSAEDLVLVQRDIGKLAQYTIEMGASIEVLDIALRIPPWEPMHTLTREEILRTRVATESAAPVVATGASPPPSIAETPAVSVTDGLQPMAISERHWGAVDHEGTTALARRHPLTVEGEEIGSFDLVVSCGGEQDTYDVRYFERRHAAGAGPSQLVLEGVSVRVGAGAARLKVVSSRFHSRQDQLVTYAVATVPTALIDSFAANGNRSMIVETRSAQLVTGIRLGNTGAKAALPRLAASCAKALGNRAHLVVPAAQAAGVMAAK